MKDEELEKVLSLLHKARVNAPLRSLSRRYIKKAILILKKVEKG